MSQATQQRKRKIEQTEPVESQPSNGRTTRFGDLRRQLEAASSSLSTSQSALKNANTAIDVLTGKLESLKSEKRTLEADLDKRGNELNIVNAEKKKLKEELESSEAVKWMLEEDVKYYQELSWDRFDSFRAQQDIVATLKAEIESQDGRIFTLQAQLKGKTQENESLMGQLKPLHEKEAELAELRQHLARGEAARKYFEKLSKTRLDTISAQNRLTTSLRSDLQKKESKIFGLNLEIQVKKKQNDSLKDELKSLARKEVILQAANFTEQNRCENLEKEVKRLKQMTDNYEEELQEIERKMGEVSNEFRDALEAKKNMRKERDDAVERLGLIEAVLKL